MDVELHYGDKFIPLQIPDKNLAAFVQPWKQQAQSSNESVIKDALAVSVYKDFAEKVAGRVVCVLFSDITRDMPAGDLYPRLFPSLGKAKKVLFVMATGTHSPDAGGNEMIIRSIAANAQKAALNFDIHLHDCRNAEFADAGVTSRGTPVKYNNVIDSADLFLVLSDVKVHYFAGYSNPIKYFLPGICSYETTEHNHSFAFDNNSTFGLHPWHSNPSRCKNPLAADQLEGMDMIVKTRPVYAFVTISSNGAIQWAAFGVAKEVSSQAFDITDSQNSHTIVKTPYLIVSPGGLPNDIDLYISQRALELTQNAVEDGGQILFISACPRGVGEPETMENFQNILTQPMDEILRLPEQKYVLFSHKPYKLACLITRLKSILMYSDIPAEQIKAMHLEPAYNPQRVIDGWLNKDPNCRINVVDGANKLALFAK
ncbi:MAG: lactate racemase domain-containing protein [Phycisphaerae bacterium]|nr:lactate racemase domain-containing protein [Phycisphaerae bacterium]